MNKLTGQLWIALGLVGLFGCAFGHRIPEKSSTTTASTTLNRPVTPASPKPPEGTVPEALVYPQWTHVESDAYQVFLTHDPIERVAEFYEQRLLGSDGHAT